jgi:hydroxymethylglutaryl-CoA lyase
MVKLVECPRDAMQGIREWIPTEVKAAYINKLIGVGFHTIDFGSFVSPKAIPQMRDTAEVLSMLRLDSEMTKLLAIVANTRGASDACAFGEISYLGFPFSISETFQMRNTNSSIEQSLERVGEIQELCLIHGKQLVVYISMGFGNPYGDTWNVQIVEEWVSKLEELGITIISLSDTIGVSTPESISYLFSNLIPALPQVEFGAHLHTTPDTWKDKVEAAYANGCRRFDGAIRGYGGCPMAKDELTGNMATENLIQYLSRVEENLEVDHLIFQEAQEMALEIFPDQPHATIL